MRAREPFVRSVRLPATGDGERREGHPWELPAVRALAAAPLELHPRITYLIGGNGSGKSTLLEAIAVAAGMNPEGGGSNYAFATRASHSTLGDALRPVRGARRPRTVAVTSREAERRFGLPKSGSTQLAVQRLVAEGHVVADASTRSGWRLVDPFLAQWLREQS